MKRSALLLSNWLNCVIECVDHVSQSFMYAEYFCLFLFVFVMNNTNTFSITETTTEGELSRKGIARR